MPRRSRALLPTQSKGPLALSDADSVTKTGPRIAPGYTARYDPIPMRRAYRFFIYNLDKVCPRCGSMHVHRTKRRRILEFWVLMFLPIRPYRCGKCRLRFYGLKRFTDDQQLDDAGEPLATDAAEPSSRRLSESSRSSRR